MAIGLEDKTCRSRRRHLHGTQRRGKMVCWCSYRAPGESRVYLEKRRDQKKLKNAHVTLDMVAGFCYFGWKSMRPRLMLVEYCYLQYSERFRKKEGAENELHYKIASWK